MRATLAALAFCIFAMVLSGTALGDANPAPAATEAKTDVPVRAVTLYSSGVGFFQHVGEIDGDAVTELQFKTAQINDMLKSLVLEDAGGTVASVTYGSQDPLEKTLKSFQVDITGNPTLDQLLNQLRGAKVTVTLATEQPAGTILGVEKRTRPAGENKTYDVAVLNLLSGASIRSIDLTEIRDLRLDDATLQDELTKALAAVAGARDQNKKPVAIHFKGQGKRQAVIGYVVETPVWKTSYRLVLGDKDSAKLQGWAIVENQTDNDWNDVQLSLVSGRPISFIEDLYQPLYVNRPVVQPPLFSSLTPRVYEEGNQEAAPAAAPAPAGGAFGGGGGGFAQRQMLMSSAKSQDQLDFNRSVIAQASAAQLGELFEYTIGSVTLPRQSSAMIPIVADPVTIDRLSIYNQQVMPRNPLNGARMKNTTGKHLLAGPLTVFDGNAYSGDAQIEDLPPGQDRLLSYGIDLQMAVDESNGGGADDILAGKIVKGVLEMTHKHVMITNYDATNKADHDKKLIIEHPYQDGWSLVETPDPIEKTGALYRFQISLKPGQTSRFTVKQQMVQDEGFAILDGDLDTVVVFSHNGVISKDLKAALEKAADLKRQFAEAQQKLADDKAKEASIVEDQNRINQTLRTIAQNSQLYTRLLSKLNDQETELEKLRSDEDNLTKQSTDLRKQLSDYLADLNVG